MPALKDLLAQSMLFTGARAAGKQAIPISKDASAFHTPVPKPTKLNDDQEVDEQVEIVQRNAIWRFSWDPAAPGTFQDVFVAARGMGMNYKMESKVFDKVEFRSVQVKRPNDELVDLILDPAHTIGAWWLLGGEIEESAAGLWRLEARLDCSMLVAFGFQLVGDRVEPLTAEDCDEYGDDLIPAVDRPPLLRFIAGEAPSAYVCVGPARYIVLVELVLCKERSDFVPGDMIGFARIQPHAFIWSNETLQHAEVSIVTARPRIGMACGEGMTEKIGGLIVADTNDVHSASAKGGKPIPYTDNMYDYYETEPYTKFRERSPKAWDHPLQQRGEVTLADARFKSERINEDAVDRKTLLIHNSRDVRKCRRQGQFDNVHLAARMKVEFTTYEIGAQPQKVVLDDIVMINMCLHDCVHMHVRWGEFLGGKILSGWGPAGPYTKAGAPGVPPNQTVFASFPNKHTLKYRAVAEDVKAGAMQVFCHHGSAYAVDQWPTKMASTLVNGLLGEIAAEALATQDAYAGEIPFGWLEFYWRVRWTGTAENHVERLTFNLERCMK